jgi:hypothetical protein
MIEFVVKDRVAENALKRLTLSPELESATYLLDLRLLDETTHEQVPDID